MRLLIISAFIIMGSTSALVAEESFDPDVTRAQVAAKQVMLLHQQVTAGEATPSDLYRAFKRIDIEALHGHVDPAPLATIAASDPRLWRFALEFANLAIESAIDEETQATAIEVATRARLVAGQRANQVERSLQRLRHDLSKELTNIQALRDAAAEHEREWMRAFRASGRNDGAAEAARQAFDEARTDAEKAAALVEYLEDRVDELEEELEEIEDALEE